MVGGDAADHAVLDPVDERAAVVDGPERRVHLQVRIEAPHGLVREAEMVRRHLCGGRDAEVPPPPQRRDRLRGGEVQQVERLPLVRGQGEVPLDHDALGH